MDKIETGFKSIFNKWWFKISLFGLSALLLLMTGNMFLVGLAVGMGVMSLFTKFGGSTTPPKQLLKG